MPTAESFLCSDGQSLTLWRWPSQPDQPSLHWAHATGFSARVYDPLLNELAKSFSVSAWDMRGHGTSSRAANAETFQGWQTYYDDLTQYLRRCDQPVWLAGHSIGGMTSLAAAAAVPQNVAGVLLIEPVILAGVAAFALGLAKIVRQTHRFGYVKAASRRRPCFANRDSAYSNYREKGSFRTWPDEWLEAYVRHGFAEADNGSTCLTCRPDWEALTFAHTEHAPWQHLSGLSAGPQVFICAGEVRSTFPAAARKKIKAYIPQVEICEFPGASHFLPMEQTAQLHEWITAKVFNDSCVGRSPAESDG